MNPPTLDVDGLRALVDQVLPRSAESGLDHGVRFSGSRHRIDLEMHGFRVADHLLVAGE